MEPSFPLSRWRGYQASLSFAFDQPAPEASRHYHGQRHHELSAWLVRRGRVILESDHDHATASPGQWLIFTGKRIFQQMEPGTWLLSLRVYFQWPHHATFLTGSTIERLDAAQYPELEPAALALLPFIPHLDLTRNVGRQMNDESALTFTQLLEYRRCFEHWMGMLIHALSAAGRTFHTNADADPRLRLALDLLEHHSLSAPFPKAALERLSGIQLPRLNQLCHEARETTLAAIWDERRYRYALQALRLHYQTVKEIASHLGFSQLTAFSRWFRNHSGLSPRACRQRLQHAPGWE